MNGVLQGGRARASAAALVVAALLAACGDAGARGSADASAPPGSGTFVNPVLLTNFPDPYVTRHGDTYYAYATRGGGQNLQIARSPDLVTWEQRGDALPRLPSWSDGETWAPEVVETSAGFVAYYTARNPDARRPDGAAAQCVARGVGDTPEGPFTDDSEAPLICQTDLGGSIDATWFKDEDGAAYLVWKNDGNCCDLATRFFIQAVSDDGLSLRGEPTDLGVVNDQRWEGDVIEAPTLLRNDGTYYLFYSGNSYESDRYAVGYATSDRVTGPYVDAPENPILASAWDRPITSAARGPGHQSIVADAQGDLWIAYHAWFEGAIGYENGGVRALWIDELVFESAKPVVKGPDDRPQPAP